MFQFWKYITENLFKIIYKINFYGTVEIPSDEKYSLVPDDSRSLDPEVLKDIF